MTTRARAAGLRNRNALGSATSPYLRQHADNPVHWQQWSADALDWARERDVPILLSIGYAACHWCHVMAHESFEDDATAAVMNDKFVCIKVDREERPDIDAVYMNATLATTGQGGWPMTCFLTPDAEPFYCGTYFPKSPRGGMPSFTQVLEAIDNTWRTRRDDVATASATIVAELRTGGNLPELDVEIAAPLLDHAVAVVLRDEDRERGGFGGAPKFPPSSLVEGLLRSCERTGDGAVLAAVERTASAMARGGIYDQLRGGFARYSVDNDWVVPHFEKMLYDNALLLRAYAHLARHSSSKKLSESTLAARIATETAQFLLTDLYTDESCFASALDADTDGVEGLTYAWTPEQLIDALGPDDGAWAAQLFDVTTVGTFEHGTSVLQLRTDPEDLERFARVRSTLRDVRDRRPQPARDDKVVTAWNGMAITALAEAGAGLGRSEWIDAAATAARYLVREHWVDGRLRRASLGGVVGDAYAVLEDYAWLATGLLALHQATGDGEWLEWAQTILDAALDRFADPDAPGTWYDAANDAETLIARPRDPIDGATPAGASSLAEALLTAMGASEPERSSRYADVLDATLRRAGVVLARAPRSAGQWLAVAEAWIRGPLQIAVVTEDGDDPLAAAARAHAPGGAVVVVGAPGSTPLLADRPLVDGRAAVYVCRGFVCDRPVSTVDELETALAH